MVSDIVLGILLLVVVAFFALFGYGVVIIVFRDAYGVELPNPGPIYKEWREHLAGGAG